jgi:hypothetical protein
MKLFGATLILPVKGNSTILFYTKKSSYPIAHGYIRVVIGERGPYIEFSKDQIRQNDIFIPDRTMWRVNDPNAFYIEYRSLNVDNVMVYYQKKTVTYADYKIGLFYISPYDLTSDVYPELIKSDFLNI